MKTPARLGPQVEVSCRGKVGRPVHSSGCRFANLSRRAGLQTNYASSEPRILENTVATCPCPTPPPRHQSLSSCQCKTCLRVESWRLAPVTRTASGMPWPSQRPWHWCLFGPICFFSGERPPQKPPGCSGCGAVGEITPDRKNPFTPQWDKGPIGAQILPLISSF